MQIQSALVDKGIDQQSAATVVSDLERTRAEAVSTAGQKNMLFGALWCIGGIAITAATYNAAASTGEGSYVVAWGAILFGAMQFFRGLIEASAE